jgi:hypothetical protein
MVSIILFQSAAHFGLNAYIRLLVSSNSRFFGKAVLSMCIGYGMNWIYFDIDNSDIQVHAMKRFTSLMPFIYEKAHLPLVMVFANGMQVDSRGSS